MSTELLELKPDRDLLNPDFEGYKLSLEPPTVVKVELDVAVSRVLVDPNQYSYLHAKVFGLHNFLTGENYNGSDFVYFMNKERHLIRASLDPFADEIELFQVWTVPLNPKSDKETYNVSLKLTDNNLAILSDGSGTLYVLDTGERGFHHVWKKLNSIEPLESSKGFYIQDAVLMGDKLHAVLCRIDQGGKKAQLNIHWITFSKNEYKNSWQKLGAREFSAKGDVSYLYLEKKCEAIYVASSSGCKFISDSFKPITEEVEVKDSDEKKNSGDFQYKWSQDSENVVIHFISNTVVKEEDMEVVCKNSGIKLNYKNLSILNGDFFNGIDNTLTTINWSKNLLEINLVKQIKNVDWPSLLKSGTNLFEDGYLGSANLEHLTADTIDPPQGITFNTEQVEDCDFSNGDLTVFERLCVRSHKVTHRYNFGSNQVLLTVDSPNNRLPPSLGVRHDVDVCVWEPRINKSKFELTHVSTLNAFGYIQASKQQKKFLAAPPTSNYFAICEASRHIFYYKEKNIDFSELRNRKSGVRVKTTAEQKVISIPSEEIYGFYASTNGLHILGENYLMHIKG